MTIQSIPQLEALRDGLIPQITDVENRLKQWEEMEVNKDAPSDALETKKENIQRLSSKKRMLQEMQEALENELNNQSHD